MTLPRRRPLRRHLPGTLIIFFRTGGGPVEGKRGWCLKPPATIAPPVFSSKGGPSGDPPRPQIMYATMYAKFLVQGVFCVHGLLRTAHRHPLLSTLSKRWTKIRLSLNQ